MNIDMLFPDQNRHVRHLLGLYIKRKRTEVSLSISDVAAHLLLSPNAYRLIEGGRSKISDEQFQLLIQFLSLDMEEIVEIRRISGVMYINDLSRVLSPNYPA